MLIQSPNVIHVIYICFSRSPKASACRLALSRRSAIELFFVVILSKAAEFPRADAAAAELRQLDNERANGYGGGYRRSGG